MLSAKKTRIMVSGLMALGILDSWEVMTVGISGFLRETNTHSIHLFKVNASLDPWFIAKNGQPTASSTLFQADAHRAICGAAAAPDRAGVQCIHSAGAVDGSTAGCPRVKFSLQRCLRQSRKNPTFPLEPRGSRRCAYGWCIAVCRYALKSAVFWLCAWFTAVNALNCWLLR